MLGHAFQFQNSGIEIIWYECQFQNSEIEILGLEFQFQNSEIEILQQRIHLHEFAFENCDVTCIICYFSAM